MRATDVLCLLREYGQHTPAFVASYFRAAPGAATRILHKLEDRHLVTRTSSGYYRHTDRGYQAATPSRCAAFSRKKPKRVPV